MLKQGEKRVTPSENKRRRAAITGEGENFYGDQFTLKIHPGGKLSREKKRGENLASSFAGGKMISSTRADQKKGRSEAFTQKANSLFQGKT